MNNNKRPRFLALWQIRLPVTGLVSILHRISGLLLFLALPFGLYLLQLSLSGEEGYARVQALVDGWAARLFGLGLLWLLAHHLLAGVRVLLIDMEWGGGLAAARRSAMLVLLLAVIMTVIGGLS